jgi:RNA polymerase sigma-70 factor (ECF subfamily)
MTQPMPRLDAFDAEEVVIEAIQARDRYAFEEFVRRQNRWVRGVVFGVLGRPDLVDDVVQQVWSSVWDRVGELREPNRWRSWVYRLARNAAVDAGRDLTRRRKAAQAALREAPRTDRPTRPDDALLSTERERLVLDAVAGLPAIYREPFVLRHLNGWSYQQIGDLLEMPVDTVETRLVRARRLLRESLQGRV